MARLTQITAVAMFLLLTGCSTFSSMDGCKSLPPVPPSSVATTSLNTDTTAVPCADPTSSHQNDPQAIEKVFESAVRAGEKATRLADVVEKLINRWKAIFDALNR